MEVGLIRKFFQQEQYSSLDRHFSYFIYELDGQNIPELFLAAGLLCNQVYQGDAFLDLDEFSGKIFKWEDRLGEQILTSPSLSQWTDKLKESPTVGKAGSSKPLIMADADNALYLRRYWSYEVKLADYIKERLNRPPREISPEFLEKNLALIDSPEAPMDKWQRLAAETALKHDFCVISGGPGTGKTSTVIKILLLLLKQAGDSDLRIALAAPTGKAAARLKDSLLQAKNRLKTSSPLLSGALEKIPESAATIHRLLGTIKNSPYFYYNRRNPLPCDCVIVDEASMVDLALMSKLTQALEKETKLILIGDRNQLFSVEAGAALADICALADSPKKRAPKFMAELKTSHRFKQDKGIGKLSSMVKRGQGGKSLDLLLNSDSDEIKWRPLPSQNNLKQYLKTQILPIYAKYFEAQSPREAFRLFESFMILCAFRNGPYGTININRLLERIMTEEGLIKSGGAGWYKGRPVIINKNNYDLRLFNGDIGVALYDGESRNLKVYFPLEGEYRQTTAAGLPEHETAFAITVHKSQGSEFKKVVLILGDRDSSPLSGELIYTGLTRAAKQVEIWGEENIFVQAASRKTKRKSGLKGRLTGFYNGGRA